MSKAEAVELFTVGAVIYIRTFDLVLALSVAPFSLGIECGYLTIEQHEPGMLAFVVGYEVDSDEIDISYRVQYSGDYAIHWPLVPNSPCIPGQDVL
jgi:hypothetical protein